MVVIEVWHHVTCAVSVSCGQDLEELLLDASLETGKDAPWRKSNFAHLKNLPLPHITKTFCCRYLTNWFTLFLTGTLRAGTKPGILCLPDWLTSNFFLFFWPPLQLLYYRPRTLQLNLFSEITNEKNFIKLSLSIHTTSTDETRAHSTRALWSWERKRGGTSHCYVGCVDQR